MKKIVSILLCSLIFCSLFSIPLSVGAVNTDIISTATADCRDGYRYIDTIEKGTTEAGWEYHIIKEQNINTSAYDYFAAIADYVGKSSEATLPTRITTSTGTYNVLKYYDGILIDSNTIKKVIVPDTSIKVEIYEAPFWGSSTLESVVIGSAVSNIFTSMFECDTKLQNVKYTKDFLAQKPYVGPYAFSNCKSLKNIEFPDGFVGMSTTAFEKCTALETVICGESVQDCFLDYRCKNLKSIVLKNPSSKTSLNFFNTERNTYVLNDREVQSLWYLNQPITVSCYSGTEAAYQVSEVYPSYFYNYNYPHNYDCYFYLNSLGNCKGEPYQPPTKTTYVPKPYTTTINENSEYYISADFLNNNWAKDESGKLIYDPSSKTLYRTYILNKGTYEYIVTTEDDNYRFNSTGGGRLGSIYCPEYEKFTVSEDNTEVKFILDGVKVRFEMNGVEETIPTTTTIPETTTTRFRPTTVVPSTTISNIASIKLSKYSDEVEAGTYTYDYSYNYCDDNSTIEFTSSNNTVVQVNQPKNNNSKTGTFQVVALGEGSATITATVYSLGGVNVGSATFKVTVVKRKAKPVVKVSDITVKKNNNALSNNSVVNLKKVNDSFKLNVAVKPSNATNKNINYSYNKNIVSVDKNGNVTAKKNGYTNITISPKDNPKIKIVVKVTVGPTATKVVASTVRNIAKINGKAKVNAYAQYDKKKNIYKVAPTWKSSNNKVATVDSNGVVTAKTNKGYCYVTATINDGKTNKSNSCLIVVGEKVSKVTRYNTPYANKVKKDKTVTLKAEVKNFNATYKNCSWSTNNKKQISISKAKCYTSKNHFYVQANVKAKAKGTYYVYVKTKDGSNKTLRYKIVVK